MRISVSIFLLLPLLADGTRDESNWGNVRSYNKAVRRHPVNPNAISQVDRDDETRAVPYYYMIVNGTTIDREVRYFLSPYQASAIGDLQVFFLPGPLANWARNIGSYDLDPSEILERYPPVALDDLPPMPRMIRRKIRDLTYGYDLLRSSGISREKYARDRASIGSKRVQSVDNSVATSPPTTTTTTTTTTTSAPKLRHTRMIPLARPTVKPHQPSLNRRKFVPKFDREEQSIFESIVDDLGNDLPAKTTPFPRTTSNRVVRIGVNQLNIATTRKAAPVEFVPTLPTAPHTADAPLTQFQFRPQSTPSTRSVDEYDEEEDDEEPHVIAHTMHETKQTTLKKRPSLVSESSPRITHPRTHFIERSRVKEILVGAERSQSVGRDGRKGPEGRSGWTGTIVQAAEEQKQVMPSAKRSTKKEEKETLSSAEILEKLSTIRSLQEELERQLQLKGKLGRKRVDAAPDPDSIGLEDLSAPGSFTLRTTLEESTTLDDRPRRPTSEVHLRTTLEESNHREANENVSSLEDESATVTTTEEQTTTPEASTTTRRATTTTTTTTPAPTTKWTTTRRPTTTTRHTEPAPAQRSNPTLVPPPLDQEFHAFHEDLVGMLGEMEEEPHFLPPLPSEVFGGRELKGGFFGGTERNERRNGLFDDEATTTTKRPPTTRRTTTTTTSEAPPTEIEDMEGTDPHFLPPLPSEVFGGRDLKGGFFGGSERRDKIFDDEATPTTRRPTTTRSTQRSTSTTTTTTEAPLPSEESHPITEEPTTTTEEITTTKAPSTPRTLPTRRFVFVTSPPITRATTPTTTTTEPTTTTTTTSTTTAMPVMPEFVLDEAAEITKSPEDEVKFDLRTLRALTFLSNEDLDKIRAKFVQDLTPMSQRFVPMGMGGRIATAAAVKTKNMDVEYEEEEEKEDEVEESNQNPGKVLVFDDEMGDHVRESRRIRLQNLNEPLRRFEKVNNGRSEKFVFVRPDRFYDKNGVEFKTKKRVDEAQLVEALGLSKGRPVQVVSNDRLPSRRPPVTIAVETSTTSSPLIGVPIHIAAVTQPTTRRITPPPISSSTASPLPTRAQPRPPAHTPPAHLQPEQLQLLQLSSVRPGQPQNTAVQIPSHLTPPPRPLQQLLQPQQPQVATLASIQAPELAQHLQQQQESTASKIAVIPVPQPAQQLQPSLPAAVQQVVTPPPQLAQILFNQQAASLQSHLQEPAAAVVVAAPTTLPPTTAAASTTIVHQPTITLTQPQTTTTTQPTTASTPAFPIAPLPVSFPPNLSFLNPIHPSIPFTPALNGLSVNQFLQQFAAQQQAIRAAAKQLQQLQRTPKAASTDAAPAAPAAAPVVLQYPAGFAPQPPSFFWSPNQVVNPWFFPQSLGTKNSQVGRPEGDVITVSENGAKNNRSISYAITVPEYPKKGQSIVEAVQQ